MSELSNELLQKWSFPVIPSLLTALTCVIYLRGWRLARRTRPRELPGFRAVCFVAGMFALWVAIGSPLDAFDDVLLAAHMLQHFILMSVAPPLIVLGSPTVPLLRGLPRWLVRWVLGPVDSVPFVRSLAHACVQPVFAWIAMNTVYLAWHVPAAFEQTFRSDAIHNAEHISFLLTSIAFWWALLQPWPSRSRLPAWAFIPYLLSADVVNTLLSATLCFSGRVLYPSYAQAERVTNLSPLQDQVAAGAEMWILNSLVFLVPVAGLNMRLLAPKALSANATAAGSTL